MPEFGHKFLDVRRPTPRFRPITPKDWPQDKLRVPNGYGSLSPISRSNVYVGQEFFAIIVSFPGPNYLAGSTPSFIVPMESYGDFWLTNVSAVAISTLVNDGTVIDFGTVAPIGTSPYLNLRDITTNYQLFTNGVPVFSFVNDVNPATSITQGRASRSTLPMPYPFLRDGGVEVSLTIPSEILDQSLYVVLEGWREYQNAGH